MPETQWTPALIEDCFIEAADVMKRLPTPRIQGYFNTWPAMMAEFADLVGREPGRLRRGPPSPTAITRADEALMWLRWLEQVDAKIVWLRATGVRWKDVCYKVGLERSAANEHWRYALHVIAFKLNGSVSAINRSKRRMMQSVQRTKCACGHFSSGQKRQDGVSISVWSRES
jgi:hypothetical protein